MKKILFLSVLFAACFLSAEEPTRDYQVVYELFDVMNMEKGYAETIDKMLDVQIEQNPMIAPYRDVMEKFFAKHMGWESMKEEMAGIYAKHFSDEELKELIAFYETPIGKKSAELMPVLTSEGAAIGQKRVQDNMAELHQMMQAKMKEMEVEE